MSPLGLSAGCFAIGIAFGLVFPTPLGVLGPAGVLCMATLLMSFKFSTLFAPAVLSASFVLGWYRCPEPLAVSAMADPPCDRIFVGSVIEPRSRIVEGFRALAAVTGRSGCLSGATSGPIRPYSGRLWIYVEEASEKTGALSRGNRIRLRGTAGASLQHWNPGTTSRRDVPAGISIRLKREDDVQVIGRPRFSVRPYFDAVRTTLSDLFVQGYGAEKAALAKALLLGETAGLSFSVRERFRRTGLAHLLAVSGLHLGLVTALCFALLRQLLLYSPFARRMEVGRIAAVIAAISAVSFTLLTGSHIPVVRACIMVCAALTARVIQRPQAGLEAFFIAGAVILCGTPEALFDAGFQLSFAAVAGFFWVFGSRGKEFELESEQHVGGRLRRYAEATRRFFRASFAAAAVTGPISLYHFGSISFLAPLANAVAVPLAEVIVMPLLLVTTLCAAAFPSTTGIVFKLPSIALDLLDAFVGAAARLPCCVEAPSVPQTIFIVHICIVVFLSAAYVRRATSLLCAAAVVAVLAGGVALFGDNIFPDNVLTMHFLDVGQGDATLMTSPSGRHVLLDGGPVSRNGFDAGERLVVPALRALGVSSLDWVVASHPDSDHIGGLGAVLERIPTKQLFENGQGSGPDAGPVYRAMISAACRSGVQVRHTPLICGVHAFDGATIRVLHPCDWREGFNPNANTNDNSLVLAVEYKQVTMLLLGDIGRSVEKDLIEKGRIGPADIIKSAHHGSKTATSDALLDATRPAYDIISVGRYNRFGMPHRPVLSRLFERRIHVLRTDEAGAIRIQTDGKVVTLLPMLVEKSRD